ncbi:histone deacetylase family protein [Sphingobacterium rhinopitheci]|uniref:histone deacetylase family protein n=1 Tax=Sphingobacterium rhinopitheci TaxID=2781960 RepID=UPI001F51844E|nr:histone deacetylase [Sphingobacterium rhinopitheci]
MLKIAFHPAYIYPVPENHRFPMLKYELIPSQLLYEGIITKNSLFEPKKVDFQTACLAHDTDYVRHLFDATINPKMQRRIGFPWSQQLVDRERYLVDGTIQSALFARQYGISFNVAGGTHHAGYDYGEGFCMLNDQAIAATYLLDQGLAKRILIIDLDVHQGNGTAHIFQNSRAVFTFSMHGAKNFPFIKEKSHVDIELEDGLTDDIYLSLLESNLKNLFDTVDPDFVFYQAGVDILETDKLGKLKVTPQGCKARDYLVLSSCRHYNIPVQVSMGGGYSVHIKDIVNAHVETYKAAVDIYEF